MAKVAETSRPEVGYETDFNLWGVEQARLLREARWAELDLDNIAEEMESLGRSQKSELWNRLIVLVQHLLKWEHQPEKRKYGWRSTINEQRLSIEGVIETSPSLRRYPSTILGRIYIIARAKAAEETEISEKVFPASCPYGMEEVLQSNFYPGPEEHEIV